jgi:hypothetical protein
MKKCTKCGIEKEESEFYKSSKSKDGLVSSCKQCYKACSSAYYQKNSDLILEKVKIYQEQHKERLHERAKQYRSENKEQHAQYNKQYDEENKERIKARKSAYYQKNSDLIREKKKIHREQHKEPLAATRKRHIKRITETKKRYYEKNKASILQKNAEYGKHRRKSDPIFYLRCKIQRLISLALQNRNYTKKAKTHEILGCSFIEFKEHIEKQFVNGLSWENRHEWHIDHVIPISSAKTEEEVIRLNHYTNLQPLWAVDNLKKRDKMPDLA